MKQHNLYITVRVTVDSLLNNLSDTVQEFEAQTNYSFSHTPNVVVTETEIIRTEPFNAKDQQQ